MNDKLGLEWCRPISNLDQKKRIAKKVASIAKDGDIIGAGSGSTSFLTVIALSERVKNENIDITIIPTSIEIDLACQASGLRSHNAIPPVIHWCFDGADEIDSSNTLIKGRGGALYRERLIFQSSKARYVVVDDSKFVERLGQNFPVPVEVDTLCLNIAYSQIQNLENVLEVRLRLAQNKDGPVITEYGRAIFDVKMNKITALDEQNLLKVPGVVCTGIFSNFAFTKISNL